MMLRFDLGVDRNTALTIVSVLLIIIMAGPLRAAVDHDVVLRDRLDSVRELLSRRQAHRHMLSGHVEHLSLELERLQFERDAALAALSEQEDQARGFERELDRLVPRLLPRLNTLEKLRRRGARTIADLARRSRATPVEDELRVKLLATSPVSIDQMRRAATSVRLLRRIPNELAAFHRDLDFQIPLLAAAANRLTVEQDQVQRRRDAAIRDLAEIGLDIDRLSAEEHRLARNILARVLTPTHRSGVRSPSRNAMRIIRQNRGKSDLGEADVKGVATSSTRSNGLKSASKPNGGKAPQFAKAMTPVMPGIDASGKTSTLVAGWSRRGTLESSSASKNGGDSFGVAALQAAPHDRASSPTGRNKLDLAQPIVPAGDAIGRGLEQVALQENLPAIEIPARPRQRVAAPDNGRVVFAGDFRSYGLLLIIEHDSEYHTLLWGFSSLGVGLGDQVRAGQIVGLVGTGQSPKLHVELRRNGQPVSPEVWLAASNSGVKG